MRDFSTIPPVGRAAELRMLHTAFALLKKQQGSILCITGDSGYGKTLLLEAFARECKERDPVTVLSTVCPQPLGALHIGELQPLYPFRQIITQLTQQSTEAAKKKLYTNIGMTVLSMLPIVGDLFYGAKEISRDLKEFKKGRRPDEMPAYSSQHLVEEYIQAIRKISQQQRLLLLLDDMQWCDVQSVHLLSTLAETIAQIPVMIVIAYRDADARNTAHPLIPMIESGLISKEIAARMELKAFSVEEIHECCALHLPDYQRNREFEQWLLEHSGGIPSVVTEYLKYFQTHSPFDEEGIFSERFRTGEFIPATVGALFGSMIEQLTEEDRTLLSLASVEGRECTVFMMAQLIRSDVLSTVRKLRSLQQRTGIIRSRGAEICYGTKTTVYEFTQTLYHKYFLQSLEYEEQTTIHAQIADILQKQYQSVESEVEKEAIAPYLAAHSGEAGDEATMRTMLLTTAYTAQRYDNTAMLEYLFEVYSSHVPQEPDTEEVLQRQEFLALLNSQRQEALVQEPQQIQERLSTFGVEHFPAVRGAMIEQFLQGKYAEAARIGRQYYESVGTALVAEEVGELTALIARSYAEHNQSEEAETWTQKALHDARDSRNKEWECFALTALALLRQKQGQGEEAGEYLRQASQIAITLPKEFQLLVSTNIVHLLEATEPEEATLHRTAAIRLGDELRFHNFLQDAFPEQESKTS